MVNEVHMRWTISEELKIAFQGLYGTETLRDAQNAQYSARWMGGNAAVRWQARDWYSLAVRGEYYYDGDGFTTGIGTTESLMSATLTNSFHIRERLEVRAEVRTDRAKDNDIFTTKSETKNLQTSLALALLYSF